MLLFVLVSLWLAFGFFSLGWAGLSYLLMRNAAHKPWNTKIDKAFRPSVSIIVPTYNESDVIRFKLDNLSKLDYPKDLMQILIVDSNSTDGTVDIVRDYIQSHKELNVQLLVESKRSGKSAALSSALSHVENEFVIVSDADCFYPHDLLKKSLPYLSDERVGAISGPKLLLNSQSSMVAATEAKYLESANTRKLGESKMGFTPLFEGGFSAYRKTVLKSFDPYKTGADDCGTLVKLAENSFFALMVPEGAFFTAFPITLKGRLSIKIRRANQLIKVFATYLKLLLERRVKSSISVILTNTIIYLFCPIFFVVFLGLSGVFFILYPYSILFLLLLFAPKIGPLIVEACQSYLILFLSVLAVLLRKNSLVWKKPADRHMLKEEMLRQYSLV
jgi:biofilm PGA synthesis N-glycosyltransferase PgaC